MQTQPQRATRYTEEFEYRDLSENDVRRYEEEGYLLLGRTLTDEGLETMRRQCMEVWRTEKGDYAEEKTWLENALLPNIHVPCESVRRYYWNGPLVDVAQRLIGSNIKATSSQLTFKMRGNTQSFAWHQDSLYAQLDPDNAMTTLTALDDVDESNGCLWIIPGSPRRGRIDIQYTLEDKLAQKEINVDVDESESIPVPMAAGEGLVFHNWMLHKSEGNRSMDRDRRVLFLRYADADAVEVYNDRKPRLGRLLRGETVFPEVETFEADLR